MVVAEKSNDVQGVNEVSFSTRKHEIEAEKQAEKDVEKRMKNSPYKSFCQVNDEAFKYLRSLADHPTAIKLLFFILEHMDGYNALVCSYTVFQEAFGISQATVARTIRYLRENGFICIKKSGTANVYIVNDSLVWKSWGKNTKYCEFPANVVITCSEQEQEVVCEKRRKHVENVARSSNKRSDTP